MDGFATMRDVDGDVVALFDGGFKGLLVGGLAVDKEDAL